MQHDVDALDLQVVAFVTGCSLPCEDVFSDLTPWAVARLRGARDKYGWAGALGVLAAARVAEEGRQEEHAPLARAFLTLVCEYLAEVAESEEARDLIRARYTDARRGYEEAHSAGHGASGVDDPWSPEFSEVCAAVDLAYVPELRHAFDPSRPWG